MKNKICVFMLIILLVLQSCITVFADSDSNVSFEGDSEKFIFLDGSKDLFNNFKDMMPGESRSQKITLTNNGDSEMRFFMSAKMLEEMGEGKAAFIIKMKKDGTEFYSGKIGSLKQLGEGYLGENFLLDTLKKGESTDITMTVTLDGDSMGNEYQDTEGTIQFVFSVEQDTVQTDAKSNPANPTEGNSPNQGTASTNNSTPVKSVKTGDETPILLYAFFMAAGAVVLIAGKKLKNSNR